MRITVVAPAGEGQLGPSLVSGFLAQGHDTSLVDAPRLTSGHGVYVRARRLHVAGPLLGLAGGNLVERVAQQRPDLVVVVKGRFVSAQTVRRLRRATGAVLVNWCPDDPLYPAFREAGWLQSLREFDVVAIWSQALCGRLRAEGIRCLAVPFGYDPIWYADDPPEPRRWDVVFVGQWSPEREAHIRALQDLAVGVTGSGWEAAARRSHLAATVIPGRFFGREAASLYRSAAVGLNILHPQNAGTHNMRTWELPATATPMVATDSREHRTIFVNGGALLANGPTAMRAAVAEILTGPVNPRELGLAGRAAVAGGTYAERTATLLREIGSGLG
ncbi:MAG: glycosyltransferase [Solirubrobacteraceae bacterium]